MANEIRLKNIAKATFTLTLASLANGSGRQSTLIDNSSNDYPQAMVFLKIRSSGTGPTAGAVYEVYLIRGDDPSSSTYRTDGAGASDAAITIENATLLGTIVVTNSTNKDFYGEFLAQNLGPEWGIAVRNASGQALNATEGNHYKGYVYLVPEVQ